MVFARKEQMIQYAKQSISPEDIGAVIDVLKSDYLTQGPVAPKFEKAVAEYCNAKHAIATNSATSALHISCMAMGVGEGDFVWTTPISFVASANCALYCGAKIDFVDINPKTYNLDVSHLAEKLAEAEQNGKLPKVVIPVHLSGQPCDMAEIYALSRKYNFGIIEDASHAIGAKYNDEKVGGCRYSDITIFSFHPVKMITSGEGGMALTNNDALADKINNLKSHGITGDINKMQVRPEDEIWNYQQISLGYNYRMTDIHAALGLSQLNRLDEFVEKRRGIAARYDRFLKDMPVVIPFQDNKSYSSFHLYIVRLKLNEIKKTQKKVYQEFHEANIFVNLHYIPIYRQPYYESMGFETGYCPEAEKYFTEALSIPVYPSFSKEEQDIVIAAFRDILEK